MSERLNVLLVEDSAAQAELMQEILAELRCPGFRVCHVTRVGAGVDALLDNQFDVILLDLTLPDSEGPIGVERIRAVARTTPIIVLTNVENDEIAVQCVRDGAQDYLLKREVEPSVLRRAIRYARERVLAEQALRESEERYEIAVAGANDGLWDWDLSSDRVYFSDRWKSILGYEPGELSKSIDEWFGRIHDDDQIGLRSALKAHLDGKTEHFEHEHRLITKTGHELWVLCRALAVRDGHGKATRIAGSLSDISLRKQAEAQLIHDALHDALTSLPNRTLFLDRLDLALKRFARNEHRIFAVLFFDLDRFKTVNDSLGHIVGDDLLTQVARRIEKCLRPGDTLARLGGDEFAILVNDVAEIYHVTHVAERVHELLQEVFVVRGHEIYTSASVGIALSNRSYDRPEEIIRDADLAMYRAKTSGRTKYEVFDSAMHESAMALHRLETDMRRAVERNEFVLHYQPIVSLESGRILGFEALLRWEHPQWGLVSPDYFIDVAEETGLIVPIGWWVLRESCRQTKVWQELFPMDPPLSISVNVSGKLVIQPDMAGLMERILEETELSPMSLKLEITESAMMNHAGDSLVALRDLQRMGVQLHVDDFGTGYSSLSYLQRFAYDSLKIDRSFVSSIDAQREDSAIVKAIIALGRSLGIKVIAEGVETLKQLETLQSMECPEAQGFWFSKPLDHDGIGALLHDATNGKH